MEDSLSDLYTYAQCELGKDLTPEMKEFLSVIKTYTPLKEMIDQQQLREQFNKKVSARQFEEQMIPLDKNRRISNRHQADILQVQNSGISRQIQNNRARTVTSQNNTSISINYSSSLNRFQNMVNEINLSIQTKDVKQQQIAEQENEMQL